MAWSRIDDSLHSHPKIMLVGNAATGLFVRLISYAGQHLTDGFVPASAARSYGTARLLKALCDAQLLHKVDPDSSHTSEADLTFNGPGFVIHDYLDYNPSRKQVHAGREKNAARQEAFRNRRKGKPTTDKSETKPSSNAPSNGVTNDATNGAPSRPDPNPKDMADAGGDSAGSEGRAEQRPDGLAPIDVDGFELNDGMRRWARRDGYADLVDIDHSTQQFVSHYRSTGARRKSWPDAWQKWIRDDAKKAAARAHRPTQGAFLVPLAGGGQAPPAGRRSTTDDRVAAALALAEELRAEEGTA
ncbi:hypothetical protein [Streptomyces pseudovenezuelae]|uniref:hypothetical protein n=1 Tax=Streptomyces pseudovenezuelae TaxID=67350 RepID=UPI0036EAD916